MSFASREEAGQRLGRHLLKEGIKADVILGLPRGGVIVAAEVARALQRPLDVIVVRKIGHPRHREYAVGALAENDVVLLSDRVNANETLRAEVSEVVREEKLRLEQYKRRFHVRKSNLCDKAVLIIDDGLATGTTMEAAVLSARREGAKKIMVAVPVGSTSAIKKLERIADSVVALIPDPGFEAVGAYYEFFPQTGDDEVVCLLEAEHASQ
jgi:putative phosphoribosyl transferase